MKKLFTKFFLTLLIAMVGINSWGYTLTIDFYDAEKLTSTSGTGLQNNNYLQFVSVPDGQTAKNIVTGVTVSGTARFGMNGGLTFGTGSAADDNVTFNLGQGVVVTSCKAYATLYDSGIFYLNGTKGNGTMSAKNSSIEEVTDPLQWTNLSATSLTFSKKTNDSKAQDCKRVTILRIVCEYTINGEGGDDDTPTPGEGGDDDTPTPEEGDKYESGNLGYEAFGLTPEGTNTYAQPNVNSNSITFDGINLTLTKNSGTAVRFDDTYVRVYDKNTLTITAPEGRKILMVELNKAGGDWKNGMTVSPACATYNDAATTPTWTGNATSVSFTPGGTHRLKSVTVYLNSVEEDETPSITISAAGVSTYYNSTYSYKMPKGLTGYWVSEAYGEDGFGALTLVGSYLEDVVVPAGEALIIKGAAGTYELEAGTTGYKPYGDNRLKGTDEAATTTGGDVYYKLAKDPESGLGFYWGAENGAAFTNGAHKAYLALTSDEAGVSGAKGFVLNFDDATAISTVKTSVNANVVYNLAGQRVNANTKGIVIMNGKKYLNK